MRIYRLHFRAEDRESKGFSFHSSKRDARIVKRQNEMPLPDCHTTTVELDGPFDVPITKRGILRALRLLASHPDNG